MIKIFFRKKTYDKEIQLAAQEISIKCSTAASNRGAVEAIHYYFCYRTFDWWRKKLDEAEKSGEKYITFSELVAKVAKENLTT